MYPFSIKGYKVLIVDETKVQKEGKNTLVFEDSCLGGSTKKKERK